MNVKKIRCPYCGKELINSNIYGGNDFWCNVCRLDFIIKDEKKIIDLNTSIVFSI